MPLTFAHPAAVIPLYRPLGRYGVLSALVIGSMSPDFVYFLPLPITRVESHSIAGLVWFCLPLGLLTYWVFHTWLKQPIMALLPTPIAARIQQVQSRQRSVSRPSWLAILLSLLLGSATHLLWDTFTHKGAFGVTHLSLLQTQLFSIGDYRVYSYKLLQHTSTFAGLAWLVWWIYRCLYATPIYSPTILPTISVKTQAWVLPILLAATFVAGIGAGIQNMSWPFGISTIRSLAKEAIQSSTATFVVVLLIYASVWHIVLRDDRVKG